MVRSLAAIVVGFLSFAILTGISALVLGLLMPVAFRVGVAREGWVLGVEMLYSAGFAALAGFLAAVVARNDEVTHAGMIAALILAMGVINILVSPAGIRPVAYEAATLVLLPIAAVLGGVIRARQPRAITAE